MCWTLFRTTGHNLKNLSPCQRILLPSGYGPDCHCHQFVGSANSGSMLPRNIHKHCTRYMSCIASTYCCWTGCIRRTGTPYNFQDFRVDKHSESTAFGCNVNVIKHLQRSSRFYPNSTRRNAVGSELRVDFQMEVWICACCVFFSNASLEEFTSLFLSILLHQKSPQSSDMFNVTKLLTSL